MPKVTMQSVTLYCFGDKISGRFSFLIDGTMGSISIDMKPEEAEHFYAMVCDAGQKAYSDYVGYAIDIPIHRPACLPAPTPTVNANEPKSEDDKYKGFDDEIPF